MRKLLVTTFVSLDGVMQAPGGKGEDPTGDFDLEGWSVNYWDDLMGAEMGAYTGKPFDLLLGRRTYDIFAAFWPHATDEMGTTLNAAHQICRLHHAQIARMGSIGAHQRQCRRSHRPDQTE